MRLNEERMLEIFEDFSGDLGHRDSQVLNEIAIEASDYTRAANDILETGKNPYYNDYNEESEYLTENEIEGIKDEIVLANEVISVVYKLEKHLK